MRKFIFFLFLGFLFNSHAADAPLRIISLAPSTTEILFALGLDEEIVAVSSFCDYPAAALEKDKAGSFSLPNFEKILLLKPDILFCTGLEQAPSVENLRRLGIKVCVSDPATIEELYSSIIEIGSLTTRNEEASRLVSDMRRRIGETVQKVRAVDTASRCRVFLEIWHDPLMTAGAGSIVDEIINLAGGINVAADIERPYTRISLEQVIMRDPECVILTYMKNSPGTPDKRPGWSTVSAVKNGRVYVVDTPDIFLRPGPRIIDAISQIFFILYGDKS
jgi:iron complex transport system substrate-binding protein